MATYRGSCHCGRITFEVDADVTARSDCDGALRWRAESTEA